MALSERTALCPVRFAPAEGRRRAESAAISARDEGDIQAAVDQPNIG